MAIGQDIARAKTNGRTAALELHLGRDVFATGRRLSGVVVFRLARPTSIRSITVALSGKETPAGASLARALRGTSSFFDRELLLSGMDQPRFTSQRISQFWNAFLGRDHGRLLSAGEHVYPFSIPLPASLPPSYDGRAGRICYTVCARVQFPLRPALKTSVDVPIVFVPRAHRGRPVALSYPNQNGTVHGGEVSISLELPRRSSALGQRVCGKVTINNPQRSRIGAATISLEVCEWVRLASGRELNRDRVDSTAIEPPDPTADTIEAEFSLLAPEHAPPSVEGTAISVIWLLKLNIDADPPLELKTPITVFAPVPDEQRDTE